MNELDVFVEWFKNQKEYKIQRIKESWDCTSVPISYVVESYHNKRSETIAECIIAKELIAKMGFKKHAAEKFAKDIIQKIDKLGDDIA